MKDLLKAFKRMGCKTSKVDYEYYVSEKKASVIRGNGIIINVEEDQGGIIDSVNLYEQQLIDTIMKDLNDNVEVFILNNLLMSVQFFENFQRDVTKLISDSSSEMEKELNRRLLKHETMECTYPDIILDKVTKNVRFRPVHGNVQYISEPLARKRLYVIYDRIEVVNTEDLPQYTIIDKPSHHVRIEECARRGYLRLKYLPSESMVGSIQREDSPQPCSSKSSDSSIYDYTTITELRTPKRLEKENPDNADMLPEKCFTKRRVKKADWIDIDVEIQEEDIENFNEEDYYDDIIYVNSKGFMNYFKNALFPNSLARALGFDDYEVSQAEAIPGKIFCNLTDEEDNPIPCEIIPSISIPWPSEQTFEFVMREERSTIFDRNTGTRYRWPTDDMIKEIQSMNCVVVPTGYWKKRGKNPDVNIEWEIAFPKAERYLEIRMSHAQIKCYLLLLTIHKTFIEPHTQQHGLLTEHIRNHMFWECEANYRDWPEHKLGVKLRKVLMNLKDKLGKRYLPHYFIKQKNLFENIPGKYLMFAHKVFHDLLELPIYHSLLALRNLRYTSGKFYTTLDYHEVFKLVTLTTTKTTAIFDPIKIKINKHSFRDADTKISYMKELKRRHKMLKIEAQKAEEARKLEEARLGSLDLMEIEWTCDKNLDIFKKKSLNILFIKLFLDMAADSARMGMQLQCMFYLKQAWYLTKVLELSCSVFKMDVLKFQETIKMQEETCKKLAAKEFSEAPPSTPVRNSNIDFNQQVKTNIVNLTNLHKSFTRMDDAPRPIVLKSALAKRRAVTNLNRKSISFLDIPITKSTNA